MSYCSNCSAQNKPNAKFCPECGFKLNNFQLKYLKFGE